MSGTVCCYSGCKKSYSTDKDVSFFKFPTDEKMRAKWMKNCGNLELQSLSDRQLRGKRICSDHFPQNSFIRPESRTALTDNAAPVPVPAKNVKKTNDAAAPSPSPADKKVTTESAEGTADKDQGTPDRRRKGKKESVSAAEPEQTPERPVRGRRTRSEHIQQTATATPDAKTDSKPPQSTPSKKETAKQVATPAASVVEESKTSEGKQVEATAKKVPVDKKRKVSESSTPVEVDQSQQRVTRGKRNRVDPPAETKEAQKADENAEANEEVTKAVSQEEKAPEVPPVVETPKKVQTPADRKRKGAESIGSVEPEVSIDRPSRGKRTRSEADPVVKTPASLPTPSESKTDKPSAESTVKSPPATKKVSPAKNASASKIAPAAPTAPVTVKETVTVESSQKKTTSPAKKKKATANTDTVSTVTTPKAQEPKKLEKVVEKTSPKVLPKPTLKLAGSGSPTPTVTKVVKKPSASPTTQSVAPKKAERSVFQAILKQEKLVYERSRGDVEEDGIPETETPPDNEEEPKTDLEFERFYTSLKKFLLLPGRWTLGGVQWDPQGKRKVIVISEPEIPHNGKPCVKRCLQCFEDKSIRVFIDKMDMTDVFGVATYTEKEDIAQIINRVAESSTCCGVPKMVVDDMKHFPTVRKRNTSYFDENCPGVIPNEAFDPVCAACKDLQVRLLECRENEKKRLLERRIRSNEKNFSHPFGEALYSLFDDLADETDPTKPKKKRTKETFFRKFLHDTRMKVTGDSAKTERVYIEKPISVDSVSQSFQDIVSKLGFNMPNSKKRPGGGLLPRPSPSTSTPRPSNRVMPMGQPGMVKVDRKLATQVEHILPFTPGSSITLDDGQEYELIGEVEPGPEFVEMKPNPSNVQQQFEIIEVDDETLARLTTSKNQVVVLPDSGNASIVPVTTRIDANDPNLSQILKAINTSHGFKVL